MSGIRTHNIMAIGTDYISSCKSNTITAMTSHQIGNSQKREQLQLEAARIVTGLPI
jgi:hypothetical protein